MDFFQHQDEARKATQWLVAYFVLAVVAIVMSVYLAASSGLFWVESSASMSFDWWNLDRFVFFAGGTLLIILVGTLYKTWRLSGGGHNVARLLGGRPVDPNTSDAQERRVLNIVEEMAIASGLPVPTVYLLDNEEGTNAFAAGFTPQDAVIGVTRGTIELLSRDELQGVIAHEFSHIFNGDMRLNLRLMGVLHGILVIALVGYFILRLSVRGASSRRKGGGAAAIIPMVGLDLLVIGYVGVFFGRVIKSAVSRQREFLADASAVQFTRNPGGIGGALKKIGGLTEGSVVMSPNAEQASHFFFSDGKFGKVRRAFSGVTHFNFLATHPSLRDRIRRIEPSWNGRYPETVEPTQPEPESRAKRQTTKERAEKLFKLLPVHLTALIGTLDDDHLAYASSLLSGIPDRARQAVHDPAGARAVVLALLADRDPAIREKQLTQIDEALLAKDTGEIVSLLEDASREMRLPLLDLSMPALRRLSPAQYGELMVLVDHFIRADNQIDLFEYTLTHLLKRHLEPSFKRTKPPSVKFYGLATVGKECSVLLSAIAQAGHRDDAEAERAFASGARELEGCALTFVPRKDAGLVGVRDALDKLDRAAPKLKKDLMRAVIASVAHDGKVTVGEGELLRTVADALGLPMPPFLPGQDVEFSAKAS